MTFFKQPKPTEPVNEEEAQQQDFETAAMNPAIYSNRFIVTATEAGLKLSFLEKSLNLPNVPSQYRAGVILSYPDTEQLIAVLRGYMDEVVKPALQVTEKK